MISKKDKNANRLARKKRVRAKISGTPERPRLNVFRSLNHIYVQIIDDVNQKTLLSCSTLEKDIKSEIAKMTKSEQAKFIGKVIGERALKTNIKNVVFDRAGYLYTGRVAEVAIGAREAGLIL